MGSLERESMLIFYTRAPSRQPIFSVCTLGVIRRRERDSRSLHISTHIPRLACQSNYCSPHRTKTHRLATISPGAACSARRIYSVHPMEVSSILPMLYRDVDLTRETYIPYTCIDTLQARYLCGITLRFALF